MGKNGKVLVAGASGLIGVAAIERFLAAGWDVVGVSRRKPELLELTEGGDFEFVSVDLRDENAARKALSTLEGITHVAYAAIYENADDLVSGWSNAAQIEINNAMLRNVIEPLVSGKNNATLRHVSILQGTKAYGVHLHPIAIPARESDPRDDHANFFFDQQDYVRDAGEKHGFAYTVLRPQLVTGKTAGALNVLPAIGVYAAIRREKGEAFGFPGGPSFVWETADADLVGDVMVWAAQSPQAINEIFNITNGDVFEWRSVWPAMASTLGVTAGTDEPTNVAQYIRDNADVWAKIVAKYGLASGDLRAFVGQGDQHADFAFASGAPAGPVAFVSTVKLRKAGFNAAVDTRDAFCAALQSFIDRKLLPPVV
ncbi:SDR family oxidoreductase [Paraburkholderia sp. C35]|uniref:SDR family oxidoreductase n=1 Tax=Paraburkholderia sp. C35 TaxID=2126993 RepID=UPI000D693987|nr:SDR family oxidoreductase [Paraburkholderia sp. C35]